MAAAAVGPGDGNGDGGFELLSGTAEIDGQGGTFENFRAQGADGSGGGAGLGGVFFVNSGATLTVRNANFANNVAQGGEGGGGGSAELKDAGFEVGDRRVGGVANYFSGYTPTVSQINGRFYIQQLTYGEDRPPFEVQTESRIGIETPDGVVSAGVQSSSQTGLSLISPSNPTQLGLDVTSSVRSAPPSILFGPLVPPADIASDGSTSRVFLGATNVAFRASLTRGQFVVGDGIPPGTTITAVDGDYVTLSNPVPASVINTNGLNVLFPPLLTGSAFVTSGNQVVFAPNAFSPLLQVGMRVSGEGVPPGTTITALDPVTRAVTFSNPVSPSALVRFDATAPGSVVGSNVVNALTTNTGLRVGDVVSGSGIPAGTTVTAINGTSVTLSNAVTAPVTQVVSETLQVSGATIRSRSSVERVRVGMIVEGAGVPAGTVVVAVDEVTGTVTLNNPVSGDPSQLNFTSALASGGGMNGRAPVPGLPGNSGNDGLPAVANGGNGGDGQGGQSGQANPTGTGGAGGNGGDGRNGSEVNPDLAFEATALALDIATTAAQAVAAGVPDPTPDFALASAIGAEVATKAVSVADVTRRIVEYQRNVGRGLTGTGGNGGDGGDGGCGGAFFGGGPGGAGGDGGSAAGNSLGDGDAGAGGAGGCGGFGAGGGAAGQPGEDASQRAISRGGVGGFGGGMGSSVDADGNTDFGGGGSGYGGAIFVRSGGTLRLEGEMLFSGNRALGGSTIDENGAGGNGAGTDLFVMRGADVTIAPDAGKEIVFEGTIADDSRAAIPSARNASGSGATVKIDGEGRTVFRGTNTYSGDTRMLSGRLVAQDGVGINDNSRIVFAGPATNGTDGSLQLTATGTPVLLTSGLFDRWVGLGSDQVMWSGSGGFAALEQGLTVNLGLSPLGSQSLVWGRNGFVPDASSLVLGSVDATGVVTFVNSISAATPTGDVAFYLIDNAASQADRSVLRGSVTADVMTVDANLGSARLSVENALNIGTLNLRGGTVATSGTGGLADGTAVRIASGATFIAGTTDTVGAIDNRGRLDIDAAQTVASLVNQNGGTVDQDADLTVGAGGVTNAAGGTYELGANITSAGGVVQNGTMTVTGRRLIEMTGATAGLTGNGSIALATADDGLTVDQLGNTVFAGTVTGAGGLRKEGGGTLGLTGAHSFTGGLAVVEGTVDTTGGGTLADGGSITISSGATFVAGTVDTVGAVGNSGRFDINAAQTVASLDNRSGGTVDQDANLTAGAGGVTNAVGGTYNLGANITSAGNVVQDGTMTVSGQRRIDVTGTTTGLTGSGAIRFGAATDMLTIDQLGDTTFSGAIAGSVAGQGDLRKEGSGRLTFAGVAGSVDVDDIVVAEGSLALERGGIIVAGADATLSGTTLSIATGSQTFNTLSGSGSVLLNGSNLRLATDSTFSGTIADAGTLTVSGAFDFAGTLSGATFDLRDGSIQLAAPSTARFTTVSVTDSTMDVVRASQVGSGPTLSASGRVEVTGCSLLRVNGVPVADQAVLTAGTVAVTGACAVLAGTGFVDAARTEITQGAALRPGQSPGIIVFSGDLVLQNSVTTMEINGTARGTGHDYVDVGGRFVVGTDAVLSLTSAGGFVPVAGQTFNLFDFDPETQQGRFQQFRNSTQQNFVYSGSTGILLNLGDKSGSSASQIEDLVTQLATQDGVVNPDVRDVLAQLLQPGSAANDHVGSLFGGNLIPALANTPPQDRAAVFGRFSPEGYGGLHEYAYRSLGVGPSVVEDIDLTRGPRMFGNVAVSGDGIESTGSRTGSDYRLGYTGTSISGVMQTEAFAFGVMVTEVSGSSTVDGISRASGSGRNLEFGAVTLLRSAERSSLQLYSTLSFGTHELDGTRTALGSVTSFAGVDSKATEFRVGAQYRWKTGRTTVSLDGAVFGASVEGVTFAEQGGDLNDRLTVTTPSSSVTGASLSLRTQSAVSDRLRLNAGVDVGTTRGLSDYSLAASVGREGVPFQTSVHGIDSVQTSISVGSDFMVTPQARVSASAYSTGAGGKSNGGAELKLQFDF